MPEKNSGIFFEKNHFGFYKMKAKKPANISLGFTKFFRTILEESAYRQQKYFQGKKA